MPLNDPQDTQQRQSLTGVTSQNLPPLSAGQEQGFQNLAKNYPAPSTDITGMQSAVPDVSSMPDPMSAGIQDAMKLVDSVRSKRAAQPAGDVAEPMKPAAPNVPGQQSGPAPSSTLDGGLNLSGMTTTQITEKTTEVDPRFKEQTDKVIQKEQELRDAKIEVAKEEQKLKAQEAELIKADAERAAGEASLLNERIERNRQAQQAAMEDYQAKFDKYASQQITNPWSKMSTGSKILANIAMFVGGVAGASNNRNLAKEAIDAQIKQDIELQKANLGKKKGELTLLQQHAQDLRDMGMNDINIIKSMEAMFANSLAKQLKASAAMRATTDKAGAEQLMAIAADFENDKLQKLKEVREDVAKTAVSQPTASLLGKADKPEPLSTKVVDDIETYTRQIRGSKSLFDLFEKNKDKVGFIKGPIYTALSKFVNTVEMGEFAQMDQAQREVLTAKLNEITGAQMTDKEWTRMAPMIPSPSDPWEVAQAKLKRMQEQARAGLDSSVSKWQNAGHLSPSQVDYYRNTFLGEDQDKKELGFKER